MSTGQATATRQIHFRSKGGSYSAIWMGSKGDLYQEYIDHGGGNVSYYPNIDSSSPLTMHLTVTSARTGGVVTPASVTYYANDTELTFNASGSCTNAGLAGIFSKDSSGNLVITGNLGTVFLGCYLLKARVSVASATGADTITVQAPATLAPYSGADSSRVTIAPGDSKNFTISEKGGSCILKALAYKGGVEVTSGLAYEWYRFQGGAFVKLAVTTQTLTVQEADVDTYSLYKVTVKEGGASIGEDIQGVLDASDPYDIVISTRLNDGGGGGDVTTNDLSLNDDMPSSAYLLFECTMVRRGSTTPLSGAVKWTFSIVSGNGTKMWGRAAGTSNTFKVTVEDFATYGAGVGDYEIVIDAELT